MLLGCIADDFTGATDLANSLCRGGLSTIQVNGVPDPEAPPVDAQAVVVALKSRTVAPEEAVRQSLDSLAWLRANGCQRFYFKYCSTFDSTVRGNIGPVAEALLQALGSDFTIACPALPENGRSVYLGHLFVGGTLLAESGMRHHPLTPMTDSNLVRVLQRQCKGKVGLLPYAVVDRGALMIRTALNDLRAAGVRIAIADALSERHLSDLAEGAVDLPLLTGGAGLGLGLPALLRRDGAVGAAGPVTSPALGPLAAVLAGSCSEATVRQVEAMSAQHPHFRLDPEKLASGDAPIQAALDWARSHLGEGPILIHSTVPPDKLSASQARVGARRASTLLERAMGEIAKGLRAQGVARLVVAGGETAGAVVTALRVRQLAIGPEIAP
ncbi:MAG: 3-oxo-tetronate kinase, partial [Kiloniellales bacterium]